MLCQLCLVFSEYLIYDKLGDGKRWRPAETTMNYDELKASDLRPPVSDVGEYQGSLWFYHYPRYSELEESTRNGCELCTLIYPHLAISKTHRRRQSHQDDPIRFSLSGNREKNNKQFRVCTGDMRRPINSDSLHLGFFTRCDPFPNVANPTQASKVYKSPVDENCMELAKAWYYGCLEKHTRSCNFEKPPLPTRVLDVEDSDYQTPHLVESSMLHPTERIQPYAALSHCWGPKEETKKVNEAMTTTNKNLEERKASVTIDSLPRNFRDAVFVTRKLGLRYIWIDALCILQDDKEDFRAEAAQMSVIFKGAAVTLSALNSPSCNSGFLNDRWSDRKNPHVMIKNFENDKWGVRRVPEHVQLGTRAQIGPLWHRAWVIQERCLSSRILHFGGEQMYWECAKVLIYEDGRIVPGAADTDWMGPNCLNYLGSEATSRSLQRWYKLVTTYSQRALTLESDRLPAFAGIVLEFKKTYRSSYLAGLWKDDLMRGMLWHRTGRVEGKGKKLKRHNRHNKKRNAEYKESKATRFSNWAIEQKFDKDLEIPSWSWAVTGRAVIYDDFLDVSYLRKDSNFHVLDTTITELSGEEHLGIVFSGLIKISGMAFESAIFTLPHPHGPKAYLEDEGAYNLSHHTPIWMDNSNIDINHCYCVRVASLDRKKDCYYWLVMQDIGGDRYRRVGLMHLSEEETDTILLARCTQTVINLV